MDDVGVVGVEVVEASFLSALTEMCTTNAVSIPCGCGGVEDDVVVVQPDLVGADGRGGGSGGGAPWHGCGRPWSTVTRPPSQVTSAAARRVGLRAPLREEGSALCLAEHRLRHRLGFPRIHLDKLPAKGLGWTDRAPALQIRPSEEKRFDFFTPPPEQVCGGARDGGAAQRARLRGWRRCA